MIRNFLKTLIAGNSGSVIIALIVTVVILSALGAAMVSLTSTSTSSLIGGNSSSRAYFLAESGFRYAESRYLNPGTKTRAELLEQDLHNQQFSLLDNDGRFTTRVFPYFFQVTANPGGTASLNAKVPGGFPSGLTLSSGRLRIGAKVTNIYNYNVAAQVGQNVVFSMTETLPYFPAGTDVYSVALSSSSSQTVFKDGFLQLQAGTAAAFPLKNGTIEVNGNIYAYRENDVLNNRLAGITDPDDSVMTSFDVAANSDIVLQKFIILESTGEFAVGSDEAAATRAITYHIPLASAVEEVKEFIDTFEDKSNWEATSTFGSHEIQIIGGSKALKVIGTSSVAGAPKASLIKFDWTKTNLGFDVIHASGGNYFLSYDAQVKVGFDSSPVPDYGFYPDPPFPVYYAGGVSFRLDNANNSYGLSFLRGSNSMGPLPDNIDDGIVPLDQRNLIVLWQQTNSGTIRNWLAYKDLDVFFFDDVERGENHWSSVWPGIGGCLPGSGLWHVSERKPLASSVTHSWYYGRETDGTYSGRNCGALVSPSIDLCSTAGASLSFWSWYQTRPDVALDKKRVEISTDDGSTWHSPALFEFNAANPMSTWEKINIDLSAFIGQKIRIRFVFDTVDENLSSNEGWYIDDVRIEGASSMELNEATLMARVVEAASITFNTGGPTAVEANDTVVGQVSGARGKVIGAPVLSSDSWTAGTAAGTLMLKNLNGSFAVAETVYVSGSSTTLKVADFRDRDNFIRAFYGEAVGCGTPNNKYLDNEKHANVRGSVYWPPEELVDWSAGSDYFTLVQWTGINRVALDTNGVYLIPSLDEPSAIIRSNSITSPTSGPFLQPELGLHTFGKGSENIYFDDFAVQTSVSVDSNTGFARAIQQ